MPHSVVTLNRTRTLSFWKREFNGLCTFLQNVFAYARTGKPQWVLDVLITQTHMHIVEQENLIEVTVLHMSGRFRLSFVNTQPKKSLHGQHRHDRHAFGGFIVTLDHSALASSNTMVRGWAAVQTRPTYWHDIEAFKVLSKNRKH